MKFGLENIKHILKYLGNPELVYPTVHIAGTNGKGSTAAIIASILTSSGYKTGLYTSPHIFNFSERIRIDGKPISGRNIVKYTKLLKSEINETNSTFFEATTAIAFQYFKDQKIDVAVIETGLGGRLDATNVIKPELSIITTVGIDHSEQLGDTIESVAAEKAGIIKPKIPCLTAVTDKKALQVIKSIAKKNKSKLIDVNKLIKFKMLKNEFDELRVSVRAKGIRLQDVNVNMAGSYQSANIKLAVAAASFLANKNEFNKITNKKISEGLKSICKNTGFRGRFEVLSTSPIVMGDVAHNPQAFKFLSQSLLEIGVHNIITIFGIMKDKDINSIVPYLEKFSKLVIACKPKTKRALNSSIIVDKLQEMEIPCIDGKSVANSLKIAKSIAKPDDIILICGSHMVLGEIIKYFKKTFKKLDF
jgi:dihydrofolate synthase/folylpolyglutamate synthase